MATQGNVFVLASCLIAGWQMSTGPVQARPRALFVAPQLTPHVTSLGGSQV